MRLFPAIDLKDGQCVRLKEGRMDTATIFHDDPVEQALNFARQGVRDLHLVDLNGAMEGKSIHTDIIRRIVSETDLFIELGGGIRTRADAEAWLEAGIGRVVIGTAALQNPDMLRALCRAHPGRIVVGLDARDGRIATHGWTQTSDETLIETAKRIADFGPAAFLYTNIARDGLLSGLDVEGTAALARAQPVPVIASGGLAGLDDIKALLAEDCAGGTGSPNIESVIAGRALYDGRLDLAAALKLVGTHA